MALPTLTPEQRQAALAKAGESRRHRSAELARLQAGEVTFADLLARAGSDAVLGKTKVSTALRSVPGIGAVTASRLMDAARIAENRKLAGLGARQRQALLDALAGPVCAPADARGRRLWKFCDEPVCVVRGLEIAGGGYVQRHGSS